MSDIEKIRNIGIIAHIDAGKTTTSERILYYTGREHKMGDIDLGNTKLDYLPDERNRGITITSAATTCIWKDFSINIIDTPGHVDFTAEVERSLRVLDGAVGIFCGVGGVEAQSETVWRQADKYAIPRIAFVNKMDRVGADFNKVLDSMRNRLKTNPIAVVIPWGAESSFQGVIDVLAMKAYVFQEEDQGKTVTETDIPEDLVEVTKEYYEEIVNALADFDDDIIEKYSADELTIDDLKASLRKATLNQQVVPVLTGSSLKNKGVQPLLDAITSYLPSPKDRKVVKGTNPKTGKEVSIYPKENDNLCAFAFKTTFDKHGELTYVRIYSGKMKEGSQIYNVSSKKSERINRLYHMHADDKIACKEASAGDIVAVVGFKHTFTSDTLCQKSHLVVLEKMDFPETVIEKAVEPKAIADKDRLLEKLKTLSKDDPTFQYNNDEEHGQILISGMGELHLDILCNRIQTEQKIAVNIGKPRVSYRETLIGEGVGSYEFEKQFGGREHYAFLKVKVEPCKDSPLKIENPLTKEDIPKEFIPSINDGIKNAVTSGDLVGYPLVNLKVTVLKAKHHPMNSSEDAFFAASFQAVKTACANAGYALLEPIMKFQIQTPLSHVGDVISNLGARRAEIGDMEMFGDIQNISGKVPIAEMFGYSDSLRGLTQGRGTFSMEPCEYSIVPEEVQKNTFLVLV